MSGVLIDVPENPSSVYRETAKDLGLLVATGLSVQPVGYPPISWDGDGCGVWSEKGPKTLRVTADFEVMQFKFTLLGGTRTEVQTVSSPSSEDILIDLDVYEAGDYSLGITAETKQLDRPLKVVVSVKVAPLSNKVLEYEQPQGFAVLVSPQVPTLEELWNDEAHVDIYGQPDESLACQLTFFEDSKCKVSRLVYSCPPLTLPVDAGYWGRYFADLKAEPAIQAAFDDSLSCTLCFRSLRLGQFELHCDREFVPFRWVRKQKNGNYKLRLLQNDSDASLTVQHFEFASPDQSKLAAPIPGEAFSVARSGGLFVADHENNSASVIVPASQITLGNLRPKVPRIPVVKTPANLIRLTAVLKYWFQGQMVGDVITAGMRYDALLALRTCLVETLCGSEWLPVESAVENGRKPLSALSELLRSHQWPTLSRSAFDHREQFGAAAPADLLESLYRVVAQASHGRSQVDSTRESAEKKLIASLMVLMTLDQSVGTSPAQLGVTEASFLLASETLARLVRFALFARKAPRVEKSVGLSVGRQ
jgi:hypothetical protein